MVASAVNSTMLTAPIRAAVPSTRPGENSDSVVSPDTSPYSPLICSQTPIPSSTPYSTPTATSQTKNIATASTNENFSVDQGSMCRTSSRARRGGRAARGEPADGLDTPGPRAAVAPPSADRAAAVPAAAPVTAVGASPSEPYPGFTYAAGL